MIGLEEQEKVRALLREAVTVLCRNGLTYSAELTVEGLLGITLDNQDVFLVNINETIKRNSCSDTGGVTGVELVKGTVTPPQGATSNKLRKRHRETTSAVTGKKSEEPNNKKAKESNSPPGGAGSARGATPDGTVVEAESDNEDEAENRVKQEKNTRDEDETVQDDDDDNSPVSC